MADDSIENRTFDELAVGDAASLTRTITREDALDNAISPAAARTKGIASPVAGDADILLCPDLEAGNILYRELTFLLRADAAGIVLGARAPVILTSRADSVRAKMASCAVAVLYCHWRAQGAAA
jgi:phosphate acetyltransferase/phosphate butyryltransferase